MSETTGKRHRRIESASMRDDNEPPAKRPREAHGERESYRESNRNRSRSPGRGDRRRDRSRSLDRDRDGHRDRRRNRDLDDRGQRRDRSRSIQAHRSRRDPPRRKYRSRSRSPREDSRRNNRSPHRNGPVTAGSKANEGIKEQQGSGTPNTIKSGVGGDEDPDLALMKKIMGFAGFRSTKNTKVPGNNVGAVRKDKETKYRQFMNRERESNNANAPRADIMGPNPHRKTQTLLLIQKLLSLRDGASPLNVIVDSLEQSARPLLLEYIQQASVHNDVVIYVSFEALQAPSGTTNFIQACRKSVTAIQQEIKALVDRAQRSIVIIDSIHPLLEKNPQFINLLPGFTTPNSSLVVVYHEAFQAVTGSTQAELYSPSHLTMLGYLATTVIHVQSLTQAKAKHDALTMSRSEPDFGLEEEKHGVIVGQGANASSAILVEMEHRRKSGRAVGLSFILDATRRGEVIRPVEQRIKLRDEHVAFRNAADPAAEDGPDFASGTFNLDLTEKQRQARDGVVLPYFDAQTGGGQGGRILYEMDREDDFDEEEDEI